MLNQRETGGLNQMRDVCAPPGAEVVNAYDVGPGVEQCVTQVRSDESRTTQYDCAIKLPGHLAHVVPAPQLKGAVSACSVLWRLTVR
jgi:hypothetical protein